MAHETHIPFIRRCYELAQQAVDKGNHPFGALLVYQDKIIIEAENTVSTDSDATRHAELNLVQKAAAELPDDVRRECILYTSTEPCIMCSGAIYWSGYKMVVYGTAETTLGKHTTGDFLTPCREVFARGDRPVQVIGPVLDEEGEQLHANFWPNL
jgi:tRNA(Arg) A34 adenosine deaminase TadA